MSTFVERNKERIGEVKARVMERLDIDGDSYNQMLFENAYEWFRVHNAQSRIDRFTRTKMFWGWWKMAYHLTDKRFLCIDWTPKPGNEPFTIEDKREYYNYLQTTNNQYPSEEVIRNIKKEFKAKSKKQTHEPQL